MNNVRQRRNTIKIGGLKASFPFAWFTATGGASISQGQKLVNPIAINAPEATYTATGDYYITYSAAAVNASSALFPSEEVSDKLQTYFVDAQGNAVAETNVGWTKTNIVLSKLYVVKAKLQTRSGSNTELDPYVWTDTGALSGAELAEFNAANQSISTTITGTAQDEKTSTPNSYTVTVAPAVSNYEEAGIGGDSFAAAETTFSVNPSTTMVKDGAVSTAGDAVAWNGAEIIVGYFKVRVNGAVATTTVGSASTVTVGSITVTLAM